jgi:AmmeMemoRadiSam system protein B
MQVGGFMVATRKPVVAGQFYAGGKDECLRDSQQFLTERAINSILPDRIVAGIVPHAGWVFSGDVAGQVFSAIKQANGQVDTVVIFGAAHRYLGRLAAVYDTGGWESPLGDIAVDEELAGEIAKLDVACSDTAAHNGEHSIEVQIPFIQILFEAAEIVPILVPAVSMAIELGRQVGRIISSVGGKRVVCIASTDLTHYGPGYGFCPAGVGDDGVQWAKETNDKSFIQLALEMQAERLLADVGEKDNACGGGAAAAAVAAAKELGAGKGVLLSHTNSNEVMIRKYNQSSQESVGYAGIVF